MIGKVTYKVLYCVKNNRGFVVDKAQVFQSFTDAREFVNELKQTVKLVGTPIYEVRP